MLVGSVATDTFTFILYDRQSEHKFNGFMNEAILRRLSFSFSYSFDALVCDVDG